MVIRVISIFKLGIEDESMHESNYVFEKTSFWLFLDSLNKIQQNAISGMCLEETFSHILGKLF